MTGFINSGRPALKYDNTTPQQTWTELLRYLDLIEKATTPEKAKAELDPAAENPGRTKRSSPSGPGPTSKGIQLTVERGPRKIEGNGVLLKITTIPRGARSQSWFGQTDLHDYTIQADVCGAIAHGRLPDVGVIGQRYSLILMGDSQKVEIRTWPAHDFRIRKDVPFAWKGGRLVHAQVPHEQREWQGRAARQGLATRREGTGRLDARGRPIPVSIRRHTEVPASRATPNTPRSFTTTSW